MVLFNIFVILTGLLYLAVLELSKNMMIGWVVGILATIALLCYRIVFYKKIGSKKNSFLAFLAFVIVLVLNLFLTKPPVKRVPAVDNKNPDVTDVVEIEQGQLTGVYNKDHSARVYVGIPYAKPPVGELRFRETQFEYYCFQQ